MPHAPPAVRALALVFAACATLSSASTRAQCPTDPDLVADILTFLQDGAPVLEVVATGHARSLPASMHPATEYWHTRAGVAPRPLWLRAGVASDARAVEDAVRGARLDVSCAQVLSRDDWRPWSPGTNARGVLFRAADPDGRDPAIGLYLERDDVGRLRVASWYRLRVRDDGNAFARVPASLGFTPVTDRYGRPSTDPNDIAPGAWSVSPMLAAP